MQVWLDPVHRTGPEAMAVDEWLLTHACGPVLRVYAWDGAWGSVGYFGKLDEARESIPGVSWVRRWTGGGVVDHRADWTYTLVAPAGERLAGLRGAASYQWIHTALERALVEEGIQVRMSHGDEETGAPLCFENPVGHDLVGVDGRKLAGAGQRRSKAGLLHQGSVSAPCEGEISKSRALTLASGLGREIELAGFSPPAAWLEEAVSARYGTESWTRRR